LLFITLFTFWLPLVVVIPPAALLLPIGTFLLLCFGTMRKLRGDPYWGVVLWVQRLHILTQYVQFGAGRVQSREAYKLSEVAPRRTLSKQPLPLGWGLMVADYQEEEMDAAVILGSIFGSARVSAALVPVPRLLELLRVMTYYLPWREKLTSFERGEDPVKYVMQEVGSIYPSIAQVWLDKTSDAALTHFARSGLGAHRVELAPDTNPFGAKYMVRTNALAALEVRPGYGTYGGDAYFDTDWRPVAIVRAERRHPARAPAEGIACAADGAHGACGADGVNGACGADDTGGEDNADPYGGCDWWRSLADVTYRPGDGYLWEQAKFGFRSSLFVLVTFVDHLFMLHMQTSELVTVAARERLSAGHPIRRFLLPFTYGAITINAWARTALCDYRTTTHRAFAFTDRSYARAWAVAPTLAPASGAGSLFAYPQRTGAGGDTGGEGDLFDEFLKRQSGPIYGSPGVDTPFLRAAAKYHSHVSAWVGAYVKHYYPTGVDVTQEAELQAFIEQVVLTSSASTLNDAGASLEAALAAASGDPLRSRAMLIAFLTRFVELVTLGHEQVGSVQVYAQDASFAAFRWKAGDLCGTKEAAMHGAILMCLTSSIAPTLMPDPTSTFEQHDWAYLYPASSTAEADQLQEINRRFQEGLGELAREMDLYSQKAPSRPFPDNTGVWTANPRYMETSVSI